MFYSFQDEPRGAQYKRLINHCCQHSDAVLMMFMVFKYDVDHEAEIIQKTRQQLAPHRIKTRSDPNRPGTVSQDTRNTYMIDLYTANSDIQAYLLSVDGLFDWQLPHLPEDISFFKDGKCWLATCSHEKLAWLSCEEGALPELNDLLELEDDTNPVFFTEEYHIE